MDKKLPLKLLFSLIFIAVIVNAAPSIGRFTPTHKIVQPVYCGVCHPEQVQELNATTHLRHFAIGVYNSLNNSGIQIDFRYAVSAGCMMCHNSWDNRKWFGVTNYTRGEVENVSWANTLLSSSFTITNLTTNTTLKSETKEFLPHTHMQKAWEITFVTVEPWYNRSDEDFWVNSSGTSFTRLDRVWESISLVSPGPVKYNTCGSGEKGMCHIVEEAVALSIEGKKAEILPKGETKGSGVFFRHEMAYTTAQYADKPVKLCGVCHVLKLPPMNRTGMPLGETEKLYIAYRYAVSRELCKSCHGTDPPYVGVEAHSIHTGGAPEHEGNLTGYTCSDCHKNLMTDPWGCLTCHFDSEPTPESKCLVCHKWGVPNWTEYFDNVSEFHWFHWADLSLNDTLHANLTGNCSDCHGNLITDPYCNKCHQPQGYLQTFRQPTDWAHQQVPCIRCHAHAGIRK